jgi:hypothetical protein
MYRKLSDILNESQLPEVEVTAEAVGDSAECFYDLQDEFCGEECPSTPHKALIDELVRYLSGDQLQDFCDDFRRHHMAEAVVDEAEIDEADIDEDNAFNSAAADAAKRGDSHFTFNGKKYPVKMDKATANDLTDDIEQLRKLSGI